MPKTNAIRIHHHDRCGGILGESDSSTHQEKGGVARDFSATFAVYGPFDAGDWECIITETSVGVGFSTAVCFAIGETSAGTRAVAGQSAFAPFEEDLALSTNTGQASFRFSLPNSKRYVSLVAQTSNTLHASFRRLLQR